MDKIYIHKLTGREYTAEKVHGIIKITNIVTGNVLFIPESNFQTFYKLKK